MVHFKILGVQANAQEKFLRIKHAYNTLLNSESRRKYDSGNHASGYSYSTGERSQSKNTQDEEDFYGFGKNLYADKIPFDCSFLITGIFVFAFMKSIYFITYCLSKVCPIALRGILRHLPLDPNDGLS